MTPARRIRACWTAVAIVCAVRIAFAEPTIWDLAANPRLERDIDALRRAESLLINASAAGEQRTNSPYSEALRILESVGASASPDPRVRFFHARMLSRAGHDQQAVEALRRAIAFAPHHPSVNEAYFALAVSLAKLRRTDEELAVYERWLQLESDREHRAVGLSNQAEAFMVAGRIEEAIAAYRKAIDLAHDNALAHWGLAVALDRAGDPAGSLHQTHIALTYDPDANQLASPAVFFIPAYDVFWYQALGSMARAMHADESALQALWWDRAASLWQRYMDTAAIDDRWRPIARIRFLYCEKSAREAKARIAQPKRTR